MNPNSRRAIKVITKGEKELIFLHHLEDVQLELDVVIERKPRSLNSSYIFTAVDCKHPQILELMRQHDITDYEVFSTKSEKVFQTRRRGNLEKIDDPEVVTSKYISYDEGNAYIDFLVAKINGINPGISAVVADEAQTYEHRKVRSITIGCKEKPDNPVIFIEAGMHAREWHARSMGLYLLAKLADEAELGENGILHKVSFVIVPRFLSFVFLSSISNSS